MDPETQPNNKRKREKLSDKFKQNSHQKLHREPPTYLMNFAKEKSIQFDVDVFQADDSLFIPFLFALPINRIRVYRAQEDSKKSSVQNVPKFYETTKFKDFLKEIANAVMTVPTLKSIIFERVPIQVKHISSLNLHDCIASASNIKELAIKHCCFTDAHFDKIKSCLAKNESLVILDFSHNKLTEGGMIGKVLSEHSARRDEMMWMASLRGEQLEEDLSKKGICEINLEGNLFEDKAALDMIEFLKDDQWTRCINLRDNKLSVQGIKSFARLMKKNYTIVSLDLRGNPGLKKDYSVYMYRKLKENIERYKEEKKKYQNQDLILEKNQPNQHKSLNHSHRKHSKHKKMDLGTTLQFPNNTNNTLNYPKSGNNLSLLEKNSCLKCKKTTVEMLKLEKHNLDLHLEIKKLRHVLLTKNIDISAILPNQQMNTVNESLHRSNLLTGGETDEQLLLKVEQIMLELTKIMETIEGQQNTQINISNHLSNANSLSRTIPLFERVDEGLDEGLEIEASESDINDQNQ